MSPSRRPRRRAGWRGLLEEARRREVPRALFLWGLFSWSLVTAAPDLIQWLGAPAWVFGALLALLALALPVVVWASWSLDLSIQGERPGPSAADEDETPELLTPADVERVGIPRRRKLAALAVPVLLLLLFPVLVRWGIRAGPGGEGGVAVWGPPEVVELLAPPVEWFLEQPTLLLGAEVTSHGAALREARRGKTAYLVGAGSGGGGQSALSVTLHDVRSGARLRVLPVEGGGEERTGAAGRVALEIVRTLSQREGWPLPVQLEVTRETGSPLALLHFLEGRRHFGAAAFDAAVADFERSVEADSLFVPASYRLGVAWQWLWGYEEGWEALGRAEERGRAAPRWARLLAAGRRYLERDAARALRAYEEVTLHHPELREGWLGLGETLFHYGGALGQEPEAARRPLERALESDPLFAPVGHHLVELALWRGDAPGARRALAAVAAEHPVRPVLEVALALEDGSPEEREEARARMETWDLRLLSLLLAHFAFHPDPAMRSRADSLADLLAAPGRRPEERLRGAQYRLALAADGPAWERALAGWREVRGGRPFDPWAVHAHHAGLPVPEAASMLAWAEEQRTAGRVPDFSLPLDHELRRAFNALVHEAVLHGDSARVGSLLGSLASAEPGHPVDPGPPTLAAALRARLALLAADTAEAARELEAATSRTFEPFVTFYPANTFAPERLLLVRLHGALGRTELAERGRASFRHSFSLGDLLYQSRFTELAAVPSPHPGADHE